MHRKAQFHDSIFGIAWNSVLALMIVLLVLTVVVLFIVFTAQPVQGQTFTVLHSFNGADGVGNFYGTTSYDGSGRGGTVFRLSYRNAGLIPVAEFPSARPRSM